MNNSIFIMEGGEVCDALGEVSFIWSPPSQVWMKGPEIIKQLFVKSKIWKIRKVLLRRSKKYTFCRWHRIKHYSA